MDENGEVVAYEKQVVKNRETKMSTKSENSAQYSEVIGLGRRMEWTRRRTKRASAGSSGGYGNVMLSTERPMSTLKIVKPLERNEIE